MIGSKTLKQLVLDDIKDSTCDSSSRTLCSNLPPFASDSELTAAYTLDMIFDNSVKGIIILNVMLSVVSGSAIMLFWGMLRGM